MAKNMIGLKLHIPEKILPNIQNDDFTYVWSGFERCSLTLSSLQKALVPISKTSSVPIGSVRRRIEQAKVALHARPDFTIPQAA